MTGDSMLNAGVVAMTNVCNLVRVRTLFHYSDLHCRREVVVVVVGVGRGGTAGAH